MTVSRFALRVSSFVEILDTFDTKHETRNSKPNSGFTLVEILVVIVILGITLALVGLNLMPDDERALRSEAQRLALLLEQARDEAVLGGTAIAWSAEGGRYRFWHRNDVGEWLQWRDDELWRERKFADGVVLRELRVNRNVVPPHERLVFSPAGLGMPFEIGLGLNEARMVISGDALGKLTLREAG